MEDEKHDLFGNIVGDLCERVEQDYVWLQCGDKRAKIIVGTGIRSTPSLCDFLKMTIDNDSTVLNNDNTRITTSALGQLCGPESSERAIEYAIDFVFTYLNLHSDEPEYTPPEQIFVTSDDVAKLLSHRSEEIMFARYRKIHIFNRESIVMSAELRAIMIYANYLGMYSLICKCGFFLGYCLSKKNNADQKLYLEQLREYESSKY